MKSHSLKFQIGNTVWDYGYPYNGFSLILQGKDAPTQVSQAKDSNMVYRIFTMMSSPFPAISAIHLWDLLSENVWKVELGVRLNQNAFVSDVWNRRTACVQIQHDCVGGTVVVHAFFTSLTRIWFLPRLFVRLKIPWSHGRRVLSRSFSTGFLL